MKTINYTNIKEYIPEYYEHYYPKAKLLFFDIETTGFIAKNTTLYLIGALWYEDNQVKIRQWFNEDGESEATILTDFQEFCKEFTHLVHFNGLGFDIPYLRQKAELLNIPFTLEKNLEQIDIYKMIRSYKSILCLDNMKQVSIERYLGINRDDIYSGKELIEVYQRYIAKPEEKAEKLLLLHNHDDLLGMPQISQIMNIKAFFEKIEITSVDVETKDNECILCFSFHEAATLPKRIAHTHNRIYLNGIGTKATLQIPIIREKLKHYFTDYRNYYYLPKEDMAIHKSVAAFVEPENKQKATKNTCYIKKQASFIPCPNDAYQDKFMRHLSDKTTFQALDSILEDDILFQTEYIKNTLRTFLQAEGYFIIIFSDRKRNLLP